MEGWSLTGRAPAGSEKDALSVSQAVQYAADALDSIPQLTVLGEVTGFRGPNAKSGHCYFQIKDTSCAVDCIIWKGAYAKRSFELRDGMQVQFTGGFNLYKATGRMSFVARSFTLAGEGLLRQQVAQLAERLRREGLMEPERKRKIPAFCTRVAVVTSFSGAVIDDVKRTLRRRNPLVELVCVDAKVQGEGAPAQIADALGRAAAQRPDCILLVRGGGSFEDLMTFNDEALARAVAACPVPVVTGIGHEPDTSICDMVSDRRCSTPTAAAESVAPTMADLESVTAAREQRMVAAMSRSVADASASLDASASRCVRAWSAYVGRLSLALDAFAARPCLQGPRSFVDRRRFELEQGAERLDAACARSFERAGAQLEGLAPRLRAVGSQIASFRHELDLAGTRLGRAGERQVQTRAASLGGAAAALDALSPLKVIGRGYAIARSERGVVSSVGAVRPGDGIAVLVADGTIEATVDSVRSDADRS